MADINSGLIAYYPFNGNANDESGNNHNAIFNNASLTPDRHGLVDSAYNFAGNQNIAVFNKEVLPLTDITISMWIYKTPTASNENNRPFGNDNSLSESDGLAMWFNTNTPSLIMRNNGVNNDTNWGLTVSNNTWYLYTVTISSTTGLHLYLNGVNVANNANAKAYSRSNNTYFYIGSAGNPNYYFTGKMDEIRFYNRVLSDIDVSTLYFSTKDGKENLNSVSIIQNIDISQSFDEKVGLISPVLNLDVAQSLEEKVGLVSPVVNLDIAATLEERTLAFTLILGQENENQRNVIHHCGTSSQNQSNSNKIWIDKGFVKIIAQSNIEHSQIVV